MGSTTCACVNSTDEKCRDRLTGISPSRTAALLAPCGQIDGVAEQRVLCATAGANTCAQQLPGRDTDRCPLPGLLSFAQFRSDLQYSSHGTGARA